MRRPARYIVAAWVLASALTVCALAWGYDQVGPTQRGVIQNTNTASTTLPITTTITGVTNKSVRLYSIAASCGAGSASVTVSNGATQIFSTDLAFIGTTTKQITFPVPLTGSLGSTMTINLGYCTTSGILNTQADIQ